MGILDIFSSAADFIQKPLNAVFGSEADKRTPTGFKNVLDLTPMDPAEKEKQIKKAMQEMARLNAPGISSQSVLNLR